MKVRSVGELQNKLDADIFWRKKEMIDYKFIVETNRKSTHITPLIRGGIALGYAHWEGFVKMASLIYISYISTLKIPNKEIQTNFIALSYLKTLNNGKNIEECIALVEDILFNTNKACKINDKDVIDTKSNLKYYILNEILISLGLSDSYFIHKEDFIDKKLVGPRNDIAHGTYRDVSYEDYKIVFDNVMPMMENYKTLIENNVFTKAYKKI